MSVKITIIGGGNIGQALASGFIHYGVTTPSSVIVTRRNTDMLTELSKKGVQVTGNNVAAAKKGEIIFITVRPRQIQSVLEEIKMELKGKTVVSVIPNLKIEELEKITGTGCSIIRAMPNLAIRIGESITCLATKPGTEKNLETVKALFDKTGRTLVVEESLIPAATVLSACGIAFFLRIIRASTQGGIQIGFHPAEALSIAAQTAKGAASLLFESNNHPEAEIDKVTTPRGITIAGLNEMEHNGLNSALIKGILSSFQQMNSE